MWNYRSIVKKGSRIGILTALLCCVVGMHCTEAAKVYRCSSMKEVEEAISYSNSHKDTWVKIVVEDTLTWNKSLEVKGMLRIEADQDVTIKRGDTTDNFLQVSGKLQMGNVAQKGHLTIDGGMKQGKKGKSLILVQKKGDFELQKGVSLQNNFFQSQSAEEMPQGAGVLVESGGSFTMDEGTIESCWVQNTRVKDVREKNAGVGGGVSVESDHKNEYGSFFMNGGVIKDCGAQQGGAVFSCGKLVIKDGQLCGNHASLKSYTRGKTTISYKDYEYNTGGAIKVQAYLDTDEKLYGVAEIQGGLICHNEAYNGGAIRITNGAQVKITGGSFFENEAQNRGGCIDIGNGKYEKNTTTKVWMKDGTITNNKSETYGGACAVADGECHVEGMQITGNQTKGKGNGIYQNPTGKLYMGKNACLNEKDHIFIGRDAYIRISDAFAKSGRIAVLHLNKNEYQKGRVVAKVLFHKNGSKGLYEDGDTSKTAYFSMKAEHYDTQCLRAGDHIMTEKLKKEQDINLTTKDIFLSGSYGVTYDKNCEKEVTNLPKDTKRYWYEPFQISGKTPVCEGGTFLHWEQKGKKHLPGETIKENGAIALKAVWDHGMELIAKEDAFFWENQKVTKQQIAEQIASLEDKEDGTFTDTQEIMKRIRVKKIQYEKAENGYQPATQSWQQDMGNDQMDTYFLQLQEKEEVTVHITLESCDSSGNYSEHTMDVRVRYNSPPKIKAVELCYYEKEIIENWDRAWKEIRENAKAFDEEDLILTGEYPEVTIKNLESISQERLKTPGKYMITYEAKDSLQKAAEKEIAVLVVKEDPYTEKDKQYIRFISNRHIATLDADSPWNSNPEQKKLLEDSLKREKAAAKTIFEIE